MKKSIYLLLCCLGYLAVAEAQQSSTGACPSTATWCNSPNALSYADPSTTDIGGAVGCTDGNFSYWQDYAVADLQGSVSCICFVVSPTFTGIGSVEVSVHSHNLYPFTNLEPWLSNLLSNQTVSISGADAGNLVCVTLPTPVEALPGDNAFQIGITEDIGQEIVALSPNDNLTYDGLGTFVYFDNCSDMSTIPIALPLQVNGGVVGGYYGEALIEVNGCIVDSSICDNGTLTDASTSNPPTPLSSSDNKLNRVESEWKTHKVEGTTSDGQHYEFFYKERQKNK